MICAAYRAFLGFNRGDRVLANDSLVGSYRAYAGNIWDNDPGAREVLRRLQEFEGISQKIAHMMTRLLITYYGVKLSDWDHVDVAVDRHVARVFVRTGLIAGTPDQSRYAVSEIRDAIIERARELFPAYPGALDELAFLVGKRWCTADHAYCHDGDEPCPLSSSCPRERRTWQIT